MEDGNDLGLCKGAEKPCLFEYQKLNTCWPEKWGENIIHH